MNLQDTNCCAIQEITCLSSHGADGAAALRSFCVKVFKEVSPVRYRGVVASPGTLYSFYFFTAAMDSKHGVDPYYGTPYGTAFANAIREHKVGEVWESPKRKNSAFHSDHSNQVWVWMPDAQALKAWWLKNKQDQEY